MAIEEVINASTEILPGTLTSIIAEIGKIALWLQALGIIVILWIVFQIIALIVRKKSRLAIYSLKEDLKRIEKKVDNLSKNLK